ncbi:MAG TPA: ABC transporter permease [Ktedonobacterales bacterium]|jgi:simple sugar transport system permease protein
MAAPTLEQSVSSEEPPSAGNGERLRQLALRFTPSATAILLGILLMTLTGSLLIVATASGLSLPARFAVSSGAYGLLISGAFGNLSYLATTLDRLGPLVLAAFSVAIAYRAGLFNIGAAGQIAVGGMITVILGIKFAAAPGVILGPLALLGGLLGGAIWGGIVGLLKAWRGAHEVVTTIMLNFVAFWLSTYLVDCTRNCIPGVGSINDPTKSDLTLQVGPGARLPSLAHLINLVFPGSVAHEGDYQVTIGLFIALVGVVVFWFLMQRTTLGYEIRAVGQSQKAARYAGINVKRNIVITMVIAGAFAGIAGAILVMGPDFQQTVNDQAFKTLPTGFDAISVALLGFNGPIGIIFSGLLFAALNAGSITMESASTLITNFQVRHEFIQFAFQALVLFLIAGQIIPQFRIAVVRFLARLMTGFRSSLQQFPLLLWLLAAVDVVAFVALLGFVLLSMFSLTPIISGAVSIGIGLRTLDTTTPAALLLTFYCMGIVVILLLLGFRYSSKVGKKDVAPPLLVEAMPTTAVLAAAVAQPPPLTEPEVSDHDASDSTV